MEVQHRRTFVQTERQFFLALVVANALLVVIGFSSSWFLRPWLVQDWMRPLTPIFWVHGLVFTAWLGLFVTQASLITAGNVRLHRRIGRVAGVFLVALAVTGLLAMFEGVAPGRTAPVERRLFFTAIPIFAVAVTLATLVLGLSNRNRDPAAHKRYMVMSLFMLSRAGMARVPFWPFMAMEMISVTLFALAVLAWDLYAYGRPHRATLVGGALVLIGTWAPHLFFESETWLDFSRWLFTFWSR